MTVMHLHDSVRHSLKHVIRNWVLPWGVFCFLFLFAAQFVMWPVPLLGAIVIASMVADHYCD